MSPSVAHRPLSISLSAVEHLVVTEELDVVRIATERMRPVRGERFVPATDAPMLEGDESPVLLIPRNALAITVAVLLDADASWGPNRIRGLVFELVERIDGAARAAGWL